MASLLLALVLAQAASGGVTTAAAPSWTAADFPPDRGAGSPLAKGGPVPARYPVEALAQHQQGRTVAAVRVGKDGRVTRCAIAQSSGSASLDKETCRIAIQNARFSPAKDDKGEPVESDATLPVTWRLPR